MNCIFNSSFLTYEHHIQVGMIPVVKHSDRWEGISMDVLTGLEEQQSMDLSKGLRA